MSHPRAPDPRAAFAALYEHAYGDVVRFAQRRVGPEHGEDVAAEVFLVAWRRVSELPGAPDDARAWLFGVARHVMLNRRRGDDRRRALEVRLAADGGATDRTGDGADAVARRVDLARAWRRLSAGHQEVLALTVLDGLDAPRAARVLDISPVAFRLRLSRARRALRAHLDHPPVSARALPAPERTTAS